MSESEVMNISNANLGFATSSISGPVNIHLSKYYGKHHGRRLPTNGIELQLTPRITTFKGRSGDLTQIRKHFENLRTHRAEKKLVVLSGLAGIGKTECARQFVYKYQNKFVNILWINADSHENMKKSFNLLAEKLQLPVTSDVQDVYRHLNKKNTIFIFDNVQDIHSIRQFLPNRRSNAFFLITSQFQKWEYFPVLSLKELSIESAADVIAAVLDPISERITREDLKKLANKLNRIPLALQIGASCLLQQVKHIEDPVINIEKYIHELESDLVLKKLPENNENEYSMSLYKAIQVNLNKIKNINTEESKLAFIIISVASYMNTDYIYDVNFYLIFKLVKQIQYLPDDLLPEKCETYVNESLKILQDYSLLKLEKRTKIKLQIHRLIQDCLARFHTENGSMIYLQMALHLLLDNAGMWHHKTILNQLEFQENVNRFCEFYEYSLDIPNKLRLPLFQHGSDTLMAKLCKKLNLGEDSQFLILSARSGRHKILEILLENNADVNVKTEDKQTLLHCTWSLECIETLIKYKVSVDEVDLYDTTALMNYVKHRPRQWNISEYLIEQGANINAQDYYGNTILHMLCKNTNKNASDEELFSIVAKLLLKYDTPINKNKTNKKGETASQIAHQFGKKSVVELLQTENMKWQNVLRIAVKYYYFNLFWELIWDNLIDINEVDSSNNTILHDICSLVNDSDKTEEIFMITARLMEYGANANLKNNQQITPYQIAKNSNENDLFELLTLPKFSWGCAYSIAAKYNHFYNLRWLIKANLVQVNDKDENGCTVLHKFCSLSNEQSKNEDIFRFIFDLVTDYEADTCIRNNAGQIPAEVADSNNKQDLKDLLVSLTHDQNNILHLAAKNKYFDVLKYFIEENSFNLNELDYMQNTFMHTLCNLEGLSEEDEKKISDVIYLAVRGGADRLLVNSEGHTPTQVAYQRGWNTICMNLDVMQCDTTFISIGNEDISIPKENSFLNKLVPLNTRDAEDDEISDYFTSTDQSSSSTYTGSFRDTDSYSSRWNTDDENYYSSLLQEKHNYDYIFSGLMKMKSENIYDKIKTEGLDMPSNEDDEDTASEATLTNDEELDIPQDISRNKEIRIEETSKFWSIEALADDPLNPNLNSSVQDNSINFKDNSGSEEQKDIAPPISSLDDPMDDEAMSETDTSITSSEITVAEYERDNPFYSNTSLNIFFELENEALNEENTFKRIAGLIIDNPENLTYKNSNNQTAAQVARLQNRDDLLELLELSNPTWTHAFHIAAKHKYFEVCKELLEGKWVEVNNTNENGDGVLHIIASIKEANNQIIFTFAYHLIVQYGVDVGIKNKDNLLAQNIAELNQKHDLAELLNPVFFTNQILHIAAKYKHLELCKKLIEKKLVLNFDRQDSCGNTVLHILCDLDEDVNNEKIFEFMLLLLDNNANPNLQNKDNLTPELLAKLNNKKDLTDLLEIVSSTSQTKTVLHITVEYKYFNVLNFIVNTKCCRFNKQDSNGNTFLHIPETVINMTNEEQIKFNAIALMAEAKGAKIHMKNKNGETPEDVARKKHFYIIADYLHWLEKSDQTNEELGSHRSNSLTCDSAPETDIAGYLVPIVAVQPMPPREQSTNLSDNIEDVNNERCSNRNPKKKSLLSILCPWSST